MGRRHGFRPGRSRCDDGRLSRAPPAAEALRKVMAWKAEIETGTWEASGSTLTTAPDGGGTTSTAEFCATDSFLELSMDNGDVGMMRMILTH